MINQELNFHSPDHNLVIKGGCDLFTTKPIGSDRKLFKTIDKHLDQILEDHQLSQSIERERNLSTGSILEGGSAPQYMPLGRRRSTLNDGADRDRRFSGSLLSFTKSGDYGKLMNNGNSSTALSLSLLEESEEYAIEDSPFGPLKNTSTRKTFAYLIAILNTTYPDHDFSNLQPTTENFHRIDSPDSLKHKFNNVMISLGKKEDLLSWVWDTINAYMDVNTPRSPILAAQGNSGSRKNSFNSLSMSPTGEFTQSPIQDGCKIYEFQPSDLSILEDLNYPYQTMWSNYWFIYNKKKKRVCFLYLTAINQLHHSQITRDPSQSSDREKLGFRKIADDDFSEDFLDDDMTDEGNDNEVIGDIEI